MIINVFMTYFGMIIFYGLLEFIQIFCCKLGEMPSAFNRFDKTLIIRYNL